MTKVLKRKVHPDIETKLGKNNSQVKAGSMLGLSCVKHVRVESSVSLLLTDQGTYYPFQTPRVKLYEIYCYYCIHTEWFDLE